MIQTKYFKIGFLVFISVAFMSWESIAQTNPTHQEKKNLLTFENENRVYKKNGNQEKPTGIQSRMIASASRKYVGGLPQTRDDSLHYYFSGNERFDETQYNLYEIASGLPVEAIPGTYFEDLPDSTHVYPADGSGFNDLKKRRIYSFDALGRVDTFISYLKDTSSVWEKNKKTIYSYDGANEEPSMEIVQDWDGTAWENDEQVSRFFDSITGQQLKVIYAYWNATLNDWDNNRQYLSEYDAEGNQIVYTEEIWNSGWVNSSKLTQTYDANNNRTLREYWDWDNNISDWELQMRRSLTYNAMNLQTELVTETLLMFTTTMENKDKVIIQYDANGTPMDLIKQKWVSSDWENDEKNIYTFDAEGMIEKIIFQKWTSAASGSWENIRKAAMNYNSYNQITEALFSQWTSTDTWEVNWKSNYYYETFDDGETSLEELETTTGINVYPNPASNYVSIHSEAGLFKNIHITDMSGRVVFESKKQLKGNEVKIPVAHLSAGAYLITIHTSQQSLTKMIVVQH